MKDNHHIDSTIMEGTILDSNKKSLKEEGGVIGGYW